MKIIQGPGRTYVLFTYVLFTYSPRASFAGIVYICNNNNDKDVITLTIILITYIPAAVAPAASSILFNITFTTVSPKKPNKTPASV